MLDAWVGDKGKVPVEKLSQLVLEASLLAAKASADAKVLVLEWLRGVTEGGKADRCVDVAFQAAVLGAGDKSGEVRAAGISLAKQLLEVSSMPELYMGNMAKTHVLISTFSPNGRWIVSEDAVVRLFHASP